MNSAVFFGTASFCVGNAYVKVTDPTPDPSLPLGIPKGDACYQRDARRGGVRGGVCDFNIGITHTKTCSTTYLLNITKATMHLAK